MRVVLQRASQARVTVDDTEAGAIGPGLVLLVGITGTDDDDDLRAMAEKVANLRVFEDRDGRMNLSILNLREQGSSAGALVISQFTLYGDVRRGRRPSFTAAAPPGQAAPMIQHFSGYLEEMGIPVAQGVFGAHMMVTLTNDGPVTIWIDSDDLRKPRHPESGTTP